MQEDTLEVYGLRRPPGSVPDVSREQVVLPKALSLRSFPTAMAQSSVPFQDAFGNPCNLVVQQLQEPLVSPAQVPVETVVDLLTRIVAQSAEQSQHVQETLDELEEGM